MKPATLGANAIGHRTWVSEIAALGYAYPSERVDNETYLSRCRFHITDDVPGLVAETRMKTRTWCTEDENTWTLAQAAIRDALAKDPSLAEQIDLVLVASGTTMPVLHAPEADNAGVADLAPLVLRELGRDDALGIDIKAAYCTGFLRALQVADGMLADPNHRAALVVATECGSRFSVAESNRSTFCFIMSDAAGAAILRRRPAGEAEGIIDYVGRTEASKHHWVGIGPDAASSVMRGSRAGEATHRMLVECATTLLERNGLTEKDIDWLVPIQTHAGVVEGLRAALDWPQEKLYWIGDEVGFSGSASIPSALAQAVEEGTIRKGDRVLSVAVGAGMNCGGVLLVV